MQAFIAEFQFFIISIIMLSNTNYMLFALTNIHQDAADHSKYIQRCVKFSLVVMLIAIVFILKFLFSSTTLSEAPTFYSTVISACLVISVSTLIIVKKYRGLSAINVKSFDFNLLPTFLMLLASLLNVISANQLTRLAFFWFAITVIRFFRVIYVKHKIRSNAGLYYILASLLVLLPVNIFRFLLSQPLVVLVNLGINSFVMYGLFVFYSQFYVTELNKSYQEVLQHSEHLEELNAHISKMAFQDSVTGLANESALLNYLDAAIGDLSLIQLNIRNFSVLNQMIGYRQGDQLLREVSVKLRQRLQPGETLFKLYNDNYVICFPHTELASLKSLIKYLQIMFAEDTFLDYKIEAYYGITQMLQSDKLPNKSSTVLSAAKMALKKSKNSQQDCVLSTNEYLTLAEDFDISYHLRKAIENEQLEVYYQPQVDARTKLICSYEALLRWQHQGQYISPSLFIPLAENNGLITAISHQVIRIVFQQLHRQQWNHNRKVSINLSSHQMVEAGFVEFIKSTLEDYPINPNHIVLEITETALLYDLEKVSETISALKAMGFEFSLDDFGHGYSSLYRFSKLNFDEVKFDRFFIKDLEHDEKLRLTFLKTVELFKLLNMRIVIEGVETNNQEAFLDPLEVDVYQGYLYAKAMPLEKIIGLTAN